MISYVRRGWPVPGADGSSVLSSERLVRVGDLELLPVELAAEFSSDGTRSGRTK